MSDVDVRCPMFLSRERDKKTLDEHYCWPSLTIVPYRFDVRFYSWHGKFGAAADSRVLKHHFENHRNLVEVTIDRTYPVRLHYGSTHVVGFQMAHPADVCLGCAVFIRRPGLSERQHKRLVPTQSKPNRSTRTLKYI